MGRKVFIPDDVELEIGNLGVYIVPGDVPTETMFKIQELSDDISEGETKKFLKIKEELMNLFLMCNESEKVNRLKEKLGFVGTINIVNAIMDEFSESVGGAKNKNLGNVKKEQEE
jgi:hypothetical protein